MSDINISGIPYMGFAGGGGGYFGPSGIGQTQPPISATQTLGLDKLSGINQASLNNTNPNTTAYYAALGAAYGRGTGGFGGYGAANADPFTPVPAAPQQVPIDSSVFDTGAQPVPYPNTTGVWGAQPGGGVGSTGYGNDYYASVLAQLQGAHSGQYPTSPAAPAAYNPFSQYQAGGYNPWDPQTYGMGLPNVGQQGQPQAQAPGQNWQDLWDTRGPFNRSPQAGAGNPATDVFAQEYYAANPDVYAAGQKSGMSPGDFARQHLMAYGQDEGRGFFDPVEYLKENQDVAASGLDPMSHYMNFGKNEGRAAPTSENFFDRNAYLAQNPDVAANGMDPMAHYFQFGAREGRAAPTGAFNYSDYLAKNPDVALAGTDPLAHYLEFGANEKRQGGFAANANSLAAQRSDYANMVRDNPQLSLQLAARLYSEDSGNPDTRTAIMETMLNRMNATGKNPLDPKYYPSDATSRLPQALQTVSGNNELLNQIYQEMERAWGGSNLSNYATDWASGSVAANSRNVATPTWTSPSNEQFFRKDISNPTTGAGIAAKNQAWYNAFYR